MKHNIRPMAVYTTTEDLERLQAKRAAAIRKAGTRWLLHPSNAVQRRTPMPLAAKLALAFVLLGYLGMAFVEPCEDGSGHSCAHQVPHG